MGPRFSDRIIISMPNEGNCKVNKSTGKAVKTVKTDKAEKADVEDKKPEKPKKTKEERNFMVIKKTVTDDNVKTISKLKIKGMRRRQ